MQKTSYTWWLFFIILWLSLVLGRAVFATETESVDRAIVYVLEEGISKHRIKPNPKHVLLKHHSQRRRLAKAIMVASRQHWVSPWILVATAFREGSFRGNKRGLLGERSVFQIMPRTMRWVRRSLEPRCSLRTVESSALCAAALLRHEQNNCGTMAGAISKYVTGKNCKPKYSRTKWIVWDRQGIARILKRKFSGGKNECKKFDN